jgi:hypothetical protein
MLDSPYHKSRPLKIQRVDIKYSIKGPMKTCAGVVDTLTPWPLNPPRGKPRRRKDENRLSFAVQQFDGGQNQQKTIY